MRPVTVIDYGASNVRSLSRALEEVGATVTVSGDPVVVVNSERLVLPGVGAFKAASEAIDDRLAEAIVEHAAWGDPLLGICLGMHLLGDWGEEGGGAPGLCLLRARAVRLKAQRLPHMGWARVDGTPYYFAHSYHLQLSEGALDGDLSVLCTPYEEEPVIAILCDENLWACQFHPEKSQGAGLAFLKRWLEE